MPPQSFASTDFYVQSIGLGGQDDKLSQSKKNVSRTYTEIPFIQVLINLDYSKVVWKNVILYSLLHIVSGYGLLTVFSCKLQTILLAYVLYCFSTLGVTMGAHRLWSHKAMKATLPLRIFLATCQTLSFQNDIYVWARDHRAHHKFSETDADPHNTERGLFFAHIGWLLYRKHPEVIRKGKTLDLSDLLRDPVVRIQRKYYHFLVFIVCFAIPSFVPWYFWGESILYAFLVAGALRYCISLHTTWLVNSLAHWIGNKPYDRNISATDNSLISLLTLGEGWHNYHHTFPQDYRASELGGIPTLTITTLIVDLCFHFGWIWDCKTVSKNVLKKRMARTGDLSTRQKDST